MKCSYRYSNGEDIGIERVRKGVPCPNEARYPHGDAFYCWLHRPGLDAIVRQQKERQRAALEARRASLSS